MSWNYEFQILIGETKEKNSEIILCIYMLKNYKYMIFNKGRYLIKKWVILL